MTSAFRRTSRSGWRSLKTYAQKHGKAEGIDWDDLTIQPSTNGSRRVGNRLHERPSRG